MPGRPKQHLQKLMKNSFRLHCIFTPGLIFVRIVLQLVRRYNAQVAQLLQLIIIQFLHQKIFHKLLNLREDDEFNLIVSSSEPYFPYSDYTRMTRALVPYVTIPSDFSSVRFFMYFGKSYLPFFQFLNQFLSKSLVFWGTGNGVQPAVIICAHYLIICHGNLRYRFLFMELC